MRKYWQVVIEDMREYGIEVAIIVTMIAVSSLAMLALAHAQ